MYRILLLAAATALLVVAVLRAESAPPTIAQLVDQLQRGDDLACQAAAEALGACGLDAVEAIPALVETLKQRRTCRPVAFALARLGKEGVAELLEAAIEPPISSPHAERPLQHALVDALASAGTSVLPDLRQALRHARPDVRIVAARALGQMGPKAEAVIPDLMRMLIDRKPKLAFELAPVDWGLPCVKSTVLPLVPYSGQREIRCEAAVALSRIGSAAAPALAEALRRRPDRLHGPSLWAAPRQVRGILNDYLILGKGDFHIAGMVVLLTDLIQLSERLEINDSSTRYLAAHALRRMGPGCRAALPALSAALEDADHDVQREAFQALCTLGPDARPALPALARCLRREWMANSDDILLALKALGPEGEAILQREWLPDAVVILERGPTKEEWDRFCRILPRLGRTASATAPALERILAAKPGAAGGYEILLLLSAVSADPVTALVKGLAHRDPDLRRFAASLLARLGPGARKAIPALRAAVSREWDEGTRSGALEALLAIVTADEAFALLIDILDKRRCLLQFEGLLSKWMQPLADDMAPETLVRRAAYHLGRLGADARAALPALRDLRRRLDPNDHVSQFTLHTAILGIDEADRDALNQIGRWLENSSERDRWDVLRILSALGPRARRLAPVVHRLLGSADVCTRLEAVRALARIAPDQADEGVLVVIDALTLGGAERDRAVEVLATLGTAGREAVGEADALLRNQPHSAEEVSILRALVALGPTAAPIAPYAALLCKMDLDRTVRGGVAFELLRRIGPASTTGEPVLRSLLHDPIPRVRCEAARTLGALGRGAWPAIPRLRAMLEEDDQECQIWAAYALARIRGDALPYLPRLIEAVGRTKAAALALGKLGPAAKPALPSLLDLLERGDEAQRAGAVETLGAMGSHAADAVPALVRLLKHRRPAVRAAAVRGLSEMGGAVKTARATLSRLVREDADVAATAAEALRPSPAPPPTQPKADSGAYIY
jgi:HEAT repeat protein